MGRILEAFDASPQNSTRQAARDLGIRHSSVFRALCREKFHPFKPIRDHELKKTNLTNERNFANLLPVLVTVWMPNLVLNKKKTEHHVTNLSAQNGAEDITRVKEGQDDKRGSQEEDRHDLTQLQGHSSSNGDGECASAECTIYDGPSERHCGTRE